MNSWINHPQLQQWAEKLFQNLRQNESLGLSLNAEDSQFIRFNQSRIRQATQVRQIHLEMRLQRDQREAKKSLFLGLDGDENHRQLSAALEEMRALIEIMPADPFFVPQKNHGQSAFSQKGRGIDANSLVDLLGDSLKGLDLAGLFCSGPMISAQINSQGLDHWFETDSFFFDYSLYSGRKAAKGHYASSQWVDEDFRRGLKLCQSQLELLGRPLCPVQLPGQYRTFLAPAAAYDMLSLLGWGGLSYSSFRQGQSTLGRLFKGEQSLSPQLFMEENFTRGLVPRFNDQGELAPETLPLIEGGKGVQMLVSSRTAAEYQVPANAAISWESFRSLKVSPGQLPSSEVLSQLEKGLYLSNLHYLNYSDLPAGRFTGMTRYACFWVEGGEVQGPIQDLRFDESFYQALGPQLLALTQESELFPNLSTYQSRSFGLVETPGLLIEGFSFKA